MTMLLSQAVHELLSKTVRVDNFEIAHKTCLTQYQVEVQFLLQVQIL